LRLLVKRGAGCDLCVVRQGAGAFQDLLLLLNTQLRHPGPENVACRAPLPTQTKNTEPDPRTTVYLAVCSKEWQGPGPKGPVISSSFRGLKPPAPSGISDQQL
jgi:hypothetical protein